MDDALVKSVKIESEILEILMRKNFKTNTFHFIWNSFLGAGNQLDVVSCNVKTGQIFLLKRSKFHKTKLECLVEILNAIKFEGREDLNWTVFWNDIDGKEHLSYFTGKDENEVREKINYSGSDSKIKDILEIKLMPIS